jgi:hypothetical protein
VRVLKRRIAELEAVESQLLSAQTEVKHLQHQLRIYRQDKHFEDVHQKLVDYESLHHQVQLLREENNSLSQDRANCDLLRYQVQSLQEQSVKLEPVMEEVAKLRVENNELKLNVRGGKDTTVSVLQAQLAELHQKEIISVHKQGELVTQ